LRRREEDCMGRRGEIRRDGRGYWEVGKGWEDRGEEE